MAAAKFECIHEQAHNREALLLTVALILTNTRRKLRINQSIQALCSLYKSKNICLGGY